MRALSEEDRKKYQPVLDGAIKEAKTGLGNMLHLMVLLDQLAAKGEKLQIQLYKDGKIDSVIGPPGAKVISLEHSISKESPKGHWSIVDENTGNIVNAEKTSIGKNDCLFDCIASYTNKSADELRDITSTSLEKKSAHYIHFMPDYELLKSNPDWFGGLWSGGAYTKCYETKEVKKIIQYVDEKKKEAEIKMKKLDEIALKDDKFKKALMECR